MACSCIVLYSIYLCLKTIKFLSRNPEPDVKTNMRTRRNWKHLQKINDWIVPLKASNHRDERKEL